MSKLVLAARDGFLDSLMLAAAIPAAIVMGIWKVFRSFLSTPKKAIKH